MSSAPAFPGLSAAVSLAATAEAQIVVHESAAIAGGRRRPLFDEATQTAFDSGADFVLSSWTSALALIEAIGARAQWREAAPDGIAFADLATGERWRLRLGRGRLLWRAARPAQSPARRRAARLLAGGAARPRPRGRAAGRLRAALRHGGRTPLAAVCARRAQRRPRSRLGAARRRGARRLALGRRDAARAVARPGARPGRAGAQDPGAARRGDALRAQADRARLRRRARRGARLRP